MAARESSRKSDFENKSDKPVKRRSDSSPNKGEDRPYKERKDSDAPAKPATWERKSKDSSSAKSDSKSNIDREKPRSDSGDKPTYRKEYPSRGDKPYEKEGGKSYSKSTGVRKDGKPYKEKRSFATETGKQGFRKDKDAPWDKSDSAWNNPPEDGYDAKPRFADKSYGDKPRFERKSKDFKKPFAKRDEKSSSSSDDAGKASWSKRTGDAPKERFSEKDSSDKKTEFREIKEVGKSGRFSDREKPERKSRFGDRDKPEFKGRYKEVKGGSFEKPSKERSKRKRIDSDGTIRLNRYIANAGICSRREADTLIESGVVKVNGVIVTTLGTKVGPDDKVQYGDQTLSKETKRYLLLNKPKDYITTAKDPEGRRTVAELIVSACHERLYPVGRLDRATTGLLLFTNDGEMAKRLTHPSHEVKKMYHVTLDKNLKAVDFKRISEGLELEDGKAEVDEINYVEGGGKDEVGVSLHSGKNRIVRRIFEHLGYDVVKLDRVLFAGLTKKDLPRGKFRFLTEKEINMLRMI